MWYPGDASATGSSGVSPVPSDGSWTMPATTNSNTLTPASGDGVSPSGPPAGFLATVPEFFPVQGVPGGLYGPERIQWQRRRELASVGIGPGYGTGVPPGSIAGFEQADGVQQQLDGGSLHSQPIAPTTPVRVISLEHALGDPSPPSAPQGAVSWLGGPRTPARPGESPTAIFGPADGVASLLPRQARRLPVPGRHPGLREASSA